MAHRRLLGPLALLAVALLLILPAASAASAGCGKSPVITAGSKTMTVNGKNRRWMIRLPQGYDQNRPYKLIFGIHWRDADFMAVDGGTAPYYGLQRLANNSAIFVSPDGLNKGWANQGGEDVTFIEEIYKTVSDGLCVDEKQVFSTGFSYGGAMSYALACAKPNIFRAIGVLSGAQLSGCAGGNTPVAYYGQHGVRDGVLPISMGKQLRDNFVRVNGCNSGQQAAEPGRGSRQHIKTVYQGCEYPVVFVAFDEDHVALPQDSGGDGGPNSWTIPELWDFFSQFSS
ncbi:Alpha/Beta hydrolase protein [Chaetomium fimeti]|jgi:poly(3-hydroxybutyrate) depolymerase|uniref:feruloyl esterase n=1 Tax=Chaetomium fimeti TaxID=1854472 RepID=A0AAE0LSU9_9PEZI|nr:Alpha/Beta hydrolase protein [Chaetomium fimeti]